MAEEDQKPNKENPDEAAPVESAPDEAAPDEAAASPDMTTESVEEEAAEVPMGKGVKIFKIFTGPHQGGEFDLGDQAYSLGKNEDADIVFSDMDLSDNHAKIAVRGDEFIVTPDQGKVFLEGQELPPGEHVIPPYTMVTMGATNLAFGYIQLRCLR